MLNIDETKGKIRARLRTDLEWNDVRLSYINLRRPEESNSSTSSSNSFNTEEFNKVWRPDIILDNVEVNFEVNHQPEITIRTNSTYVPYRTALTYTLNSMVYDGDRNRLRWSKEISGNFISDMNMNSYPFDVQEIKIYLALNSKQVTFARSIPANISVMDKMENSQYIMMSYRMCSITHKGMESLLVQLTLGRNLLSFFLTTCLPTIIVNVIGHITNYYEEGDFDVAIGVNLTSMLVLITMFISVSADLPKSSEVKIVEIWMLFSLFLPFLDVMLRTWINYLKKRHREVQETGHSSSIFTIGQNTTPVLNIKQRKEGNVYKEEKKLKKWILYLNRFIFVVKPIAFVLFCIGYWCYGTYLKQSAQTTSVEIQNNCIQ